MSINAIDENIVCSILDSLPLESIIAFTSTCKAFHSIRDICIAKNPVVKAYREFDDKDEYMNVLCNSHIMIQSSIKEPILKKSREYDREKIENTCKIICYSGFLTSYFPDSMLRTYCLEMLNKKYGYTKKKTCESYLDILFIYNETAYLMKYNIDIFDMYQMIYHMQARKYRRVIIAFDNIKSIKTTHYLNSVKIIMDFIYKQSNIKIKAIGICLIYIYINLMLENILKDIHKTKLFLHTVMNKSEEFCNDINNKLKQIPKYLKTYIVNAIQSCSKNINDRLNILE